MQKVVSGMLLDIAEEKNGYSIGEPWRFTDFSLAAVVPLTRVTRDKRSYRLLSERKSDVKVRDTGNIDILSIRNDGEFPVLIKAGEVLTGATQSRAVTITQVVMPEETLKVDCACVYSSKGIRGGQGMTPEFYAPTRVRRILYRGHYGQDRKLSSRYTRRQSDIWEGVNRHAAEVGSSVRSFAGFASSIGPEDFRPHVHTTFPDIRDMLQNLGDDYHTPKEDLAGRTGETQDKLKGILESVPKTDNQVGLVMLAMTGLESMEAFDHPDAWEGIRRAVLGADAGILSDVSDRDGLFEFRADKARDIITSVLRQDFAEKVAVDRERTQTVILDATQFTGEVVTLDGAPIHCSFVRKES